MYFFDTSFYGPQSRCIPLPSIIINYMGIVARSQTRRTCFKFSRFLTLLFRALKDDLSEEESLGLPSNEVVTPGMLHQIQMDDEVADKIRGRPRGEEDNEDDGADVDN